MTFAFCIMDGITGPAWLTVIIANEQGCMIDQKAVASIVNSPAVLFFQSKCLVGLTING